jgi:hypothetical protein
VVLLALEKRSLERRETRRDSHQAVPGLQVQIATGLITKCGIVRNDMVAPRDDAAISGSMV